MTEESTPDGVRSIDTVIRGFTDAELALREVSGTVERIRSASEQLDASRADQAAARASLTETSTAVRDLGTRLEATVSELQHVKSILASLEPERLWQQLESHSAALAESTRRIEERMGAHDRAVRRLALLAVAGIVIALVTLAVVGAYAFGAIPGA